MELSGIYSNIVNAFQKYFPVISIIGEKRNGISPEINPATLQYHVRNRYNLRT